MIVRRLPGAATGAGLGPEGGEPVFLAIAQPDHAQVSGLFGQRWRLGGEPGREARFAIANHDIGWAGLDAWVRWNADTSEPFSFLDHPLDAKYAAYRAGADLLESGSAYAGWLCSRHLQRFAAMLDDELSADYLRHETDRQGRLAALLTPAQQASAAFDLALLRFCDALSLYLCLNEPGENTVEWYRNGLAFGDRTIAVRWDGPRRVRLEPDPFERPVEVALPGQLVDGAGNVVANHVTEVLVGG